MRDLEKRIEALLFVHGDAMTIERLGRLLSVNKTEIRTALVGLDENLMQSALQLVYHGDSVGLVTREHLSKDIEPLVKEVGERDLSRASAETLAVVVYRGPIPKRDLDYIRGVNSNYSLRNLLIRGLIEKREDLKDRRTILYRPSLELLKFLGISRMEELPEYEEFKRRIGDFMSSKLKEEP